MEITLAKTQDEISSTYPVMQQLRPHLDPIAYLASVNRQYQADNYMLAYIENNNEVKAVAGFRIQENLCDGKFLYVNDLVTDQASRSKQYGQKLFSWLKDYAKDNNCNVLSLDSGVQRFDAHRFYLTNKMNITSHHFCLSL